MRRLSTGALLAHHIEVSMRQYLRGITLARGHLRSLVTVHSCALLGLILLAPFAAADPCVDYRHYIHKTAALELPWQRAEGVAVASGRAYVGKGEASLGNAG